MGIGLDTFADYMAYFSGQLQVDGFGENYFIMVAQTSAFCVLSISELFHMLGMTSIRKSVVHNFRTKNKLLWASFFAGIALQVGVVLIPGVNTFFKCSSGLSWQHWLMIFGLSILPIIAHEIVALILWLKDKKK